MPGFTFGTTGPNPNIKTARAYRWNILQLGPVSRSSISDNPSWYAKSLTFPTIGTSVEEVAGSSIKYKFASFTEFGNVTVSFYNVVTKTGTSLNSLVEQWSFRVMGAGDVSKGKSVVLNQLHVADDYKESSRFALTGETGNYITKFTLHNSWPFKVTHSQLDYSKNELAEVSVELVYDWISFQSDQTTSGNPNPNSAENKNKKNT